MERIISKLLIFIAIQFRTHFAASPKNLESTIFIWKPLMPIERSSVQVQRSFDHMAEKLLIGRGKNLSPKHFSGNEVFGSDNLSQKFSAKSDCSGQQISKSKVLFEKKLLKVLFICTLRCWQTCRIFFKTCRKPKFSAQAPELFSLLSEKVLHTKNLFCWKSCSFLKRSCAQVQCNTENPVEKVMIEVRKLLLKSDNTFKTNWVSQQFAPY